VYDEATFTEYLGALEVPERFEALATRDGIHTVLWNHSKALLANRLLRHLMRSPDWYPVYIDSVSIVFRRMADAAAAGGPPPVDLGHQPPGVVLERGVAPPTRLDRILTGWVPWRRQPFLTEVRLGIVYALLGFPRQAESCLLRATSLRAVPAEARFDLGLVYDGMGLTEKAILEYEEARRATGLLREPLGWLFRRDFRRDLQLRLGSAYIHAGMEDRGVPLLERSGRRGRGRLLAFEGYRLQSEGDNAAAVEKYGEALVQDPESPEILHNLGLALIRAGVDRLDAGGDPDPLVEEAADAFRRAIEARPDFASAHFNLGLVLLQGGQTQQATESFARAADLDPTDPGFRYQLGYAHLQAGRLPEAAAALSEAIRLQPEFLQARFHLGLTLQGMGDWAGALESFRTCFEQGMQDARLALQIAQIHARQGDTDEALLWLGRTGMSVPELRSVVGGIPELAPLIDRIEAGEVGPPS
jgi:tetratricopeptide (TPR) repeat protein